MSEKITNFFRRVEAAQDNPGPSLDEEGDCPEPELDNDDDQIISDSGESGGEDGEISSKASCSTATPSTSAGRKQGPTFHVGQKKKHRHQQRAFARRWLKQFWWLRYDDAHTSPCTATAAELAKWLSMEYRNEKLQVSLLLFISPNKNALAMSGRPYTST